MGAANVGLAALGRSAGRPAGGDSGDGLQIGGRARVAQIGRGPIEWPLL